jgi:hypothetical protein
MWRLARSSAIAMLYLIGDGCDQSGDFITETSPFYSKRIATPPDGHEQIAQRAKRFAQQYQMKLHYVPGHFTPKEYSISVTRLDTNIVATNIKSGKFTIITAYSRKTPSEESRHLVSNFVCAVMLQTEACEKSNKESP